jgi:hypothetical protein
MSASELKAAVLHLLLHVAEVPEAVVVLTRRDALAPEDMPLGDAQSTEMLRES